MRLGRHYILGAVLLAALLLPLWPAPATGQGVPPELSIYGVRGFFPQPRVTTNFLEDAYLTRPDEGWIVGDKGTIIRYSNGRFQDWTDPRRTENTIHQLSFRSPDDGWAAGGVGTILRYRNGLWTREESGTRTWLQTIIGIDDDEAWAMGSDGMILHRKGGRWRQVESPTTLALKWVDFVSPTDGWAVGTDALVRLVNGRWVRQPLPLTYRVELYALDMVDANDGWIVGQYGTILRYDGRAWQQYPSPTEELLEKVKVVSKHEAYACGWNGTVLRYLDGTWTAFPSLTDQKLFGCHFSSGQRGLVVGHYGLMWLYDGTERHYFPAMRKRAGNWQVLVARAPR